jgi:uncharacterized protein involved in response to NO
MDRLPDEWVNAFRRDREAPPTLVDPGPERRVARLLGAFIVAGLVFLVLPGTVLGVWNLVGISSQRELAGVSAGWIQAHGHAQFFGWVGTFIIGISLYTLPKFRGGWCRSIPVGWVLWALWTGGVGLRWAAGVSTFLHPAAFRVSAVMELAAGVLLVWEVSASGPKHKKGQAWELPIFSGLAALVGLLAWQVVLPVGETRTLISVAVWAFAFPVVVGYSTKFFPGLVGTAAASKRGLGVGVALAWVAAVGFVVDSVALAAVGSCAAAGAVCWSLRMFHPGVGKPKTTGVYHRYPQFARLAYVWLGVSAALGFGVPRPGMLGASRHAFTVGFLATLIFSIGPRILPSFLNSRELWSARLMRWALLLITAGCAARVISEPLAYGEIVAAAWTALPVSAFAELTAVALFAVNLGMSLATPIPSWFGRKHVNERMSLYWLVASYPATRRLLIDCGLSTLGRAERIPKSLSVGDAAAADGVGAELVVERLGDFFDSRLAGPARNGERPV